MRRRECFADSLARCFWLGGERAREEGVGASAVRKRGGQCAGAGKGRLVRRRGLKADSAQARAEGGL